ncbi:MAG: hypothetical protein CR994_08010 [Maribacter sp.]|nr:MAG: hypothetical protein CR994_08010 [Maribacter sp.]
MVLMRLKAARTTLPPHLASMPFCQFAKSQSLRDISDGLRSATGNLDHLGMPNHPPFKLSTKIEAGSFSGITITFFWEVWDSKSVLNLRTSG